MKKLILAGEWKPGESVGDVMKLAERFGVSFGTVRAAEQIMVEEGWLEPIRPGIPTRVADPVPTATSRDKLMAELRDLHSQLGTLLTRLEQLDS
jgi:DNA-binding FadR family transcriptional regulator